MTLLLAEAADAIMTAGGTGGIVALVLILDRAGVLTKKGKSDESNPRISRTMAREEGERIGAEKAWRREQSEAMRALSESHAKLHVQGERSLTILEHIDAGIEKLNDNLERRS